MSAIILFGFNIHQNNLITAMDLNLFSTPAAFTELQTAFLVILEIYHIKFNLTQYTVSVLRSTYSSAKG
jgi:hypothetical protein